jgi:hypothetical protein
VLEVAGVIFIPENGDGPEQAKIGGNKKSPGLSF